MIISKALDDEASSSEEKFASLVKMVGSRKQDEMKWNEPKARHPLYGEMDISFFP